MIKRPRTQNISAEMNAYVMKGQAAFMDSAFIGKSGRRLSRSEIVTIRLDPKLRYLAELASRKQRRTLSSFIEWAIEQSLTKVQFTENSTISDDAPELWDVDDCDRFVKLALRDESLLNFDEQVLWKQLKEDAGIRSKNEQNFDWKNIRILWARLIRPPAPKPEKSAARKT